MLKVSLQNISKEVDDLEQEKNIGKIMKNYNKINNDIKKLNNYITTIKKEFENSDLEIKEITEEELFQKYSAEITDEITEEILKEENLETQIEKYKIMLGKINSCKKYLETQKLNIIECDKSNNNNKEIKPKKTKQKVVLSSSDSD